MTWPGKHPITPFRDVAEASVEAAEAEAPKPRRLPEPATIRKFAKQVNRAAHALEDDDVSDMPHPADLRAAAEVLESVAANREDSYGNRQR